MRQDEVPPFWMPALVSGCLFLSLEYSVDLWMAPWNHPDLQITLPLLTVSIATAAIILSMAIVVRSLAYCLADHPLLPLVLLGLLGGTIWPFLIGPSPGYTALLTYLIPILLVALQYSRLSSWTTEFHWLCCVVMALGTPGLLKALHLTVFTGSPYYWRALLAGVGFFLFLTLGEMGYRALSRWKIFSTKTTCLALSALLMVLGIRVLARPDNSFESYFNGSLEEWTMNDRTHRPNIILMSVDALRWDLVPPRSSHLNLPNLQALRRDSVTFESAFSTSSWTLPAHVSLFSGLLPSQHGAVFPWSRAAPGTPFYTQYLQKAGYATGAFTDGLLMRKEVGFSRGFETYWERPVPYGGYVPGSLAIAKSMFPALAPSFEAKIGIRTHGNVADRKPLRYMDRNVEHAFRWMDGRDGSPFFVFLHTFQVHDWKRKYPHSIRRIRENQPGLLTFSASTAAENSYSKRRALYEYGVEILDRSIGRLTDKLKEKGLYQDTLIVLTSDHGERLDNRKMFPHGRGQLQESLIHIPLWMKLPYQQKAGDTHQGLVQITDVFPLIFESIGADSPETPDQFPQKTPLHTSSDSPSKGRGFVHGSVNGGEAGETGLRFFVRSRGHKYTKTPSIEREQYYRVRNESLDEERLTAESVPGETRGRLTGEMQWLLQEHENHFEPYFIEDIEPSVQQELKGMGYL